jgi:Tol biopolymer transport system component
MSNPGLAMPSDHAFAPGDRVDHYTVVSFIGAGGMGEVYRAHDARLGREVALKVLPPRYAADEARMRRFSSEAQTIAKLNHPNIVSLFDVGTHDGRPYIVTELLRGRTLRGWIESHSHVPVKSIFGFAIQLARALAAAHEKGVVHRDLKPSNVLVTNDDHLVVLDFGLAKLLERDSTGVDDDTASELSSPGTVIGSLSYMAPEQVEAVAIDHRADIFSFGVILFELASGRRPFIGTSLPATYTAILRDDPPDLATLRPDLPSSLVAIVRRCLQKDPSARFQSASDLLFTLRAAADGGAPSRTHRAPSARGRRRVAAALLSSIVALFALAVSIAPFRGEREAPPVSRVTRLTTVGNVPRGVISTDGEFLAYCIIRESKMMKARLRHLRSGSEIDLIPEFAGWVHPFAFAPDGKFVYFNEDSERPPRRIRLARIGLLGGKPEVLVEQSDFIVSEALSPDGNMLAWATLTVEGESIVRVIPTSGGKPRSIHVTRELGVEGLAWLPDSKTLIAAPFTPRATAARAMPMLLALDVPSGRVTRIPLQGDARLGVITPVPGRNSLVGTTESDEIVEVDIPSGTVRQLARGSYRVLNVRSDGGILAGLREARFNLWTLDTASGVTTRLPQIPGVVDGMTGLTWAADGRIYFTAAASDHADAALWVCDGDGQNRRQLTRPPTGSTDSAPAFARDGSGIFFVRSDPRSKTEALCRVPVNGGTVTVLLRAPVVRQPFPLSDGTVVLESGDLNGPTKIIRITPGQRSAPVVLQASCTLNDVDPTGRLGLCCTHDSRERLFSLTDGAAVWNGDLPAIFVRFDSSGRLSYANRARANNLFLVPRQGEEPVALTKFSGEKIVNFTWAPDGKRLVLSKGNVAKDMVIIERAAPPPTTLTARLRSKLER